MRCFIAIELPELLKKALARIQGELRQSGADIRWVRPESVHLTIKFLGEVREADAERIVRVLEGICNTHSPFRLRVAGVGVFPGIRSPRVIWAGLDNSEPLSSLRDEIEVGMAGLGFERENRKFSPHLTLGRFRSLKGKDAVLGSADAHKDTEFGIIPVDCIVLMKSELRPGGAVYSRIASFRLS